MEPKERDDVVLLSLTRDQWAAVCDLGLRDELLEVASKGDAQLVWAWLAGFGVPGAQENISEV